jgi:hypothetical protein
LADNAVNGNNSMGFNAIYSIFIFCYVIILLHQIGLLCKQPLLNTSSSINLHHSSKV